MVRRRAIWATLLLLSVAIQGSTMAEKRRYYTTGKEAERALGDLSSVAVQAYPFFERENFELKKAPGPRDWLANHTEPGQTFEQYVRSAPNRVTKVRRVIYIQPLGEVSPEQEKILTAMKEFLAAYFHTDTALLPAISLDTEKTVWRSNPYTGQPQVLAGSVMDNLLLPRLPEDAFCILGITTADLYPAPSWNFVFGQASLKRRIGVYSLARYDPAFYGDTASSGERQKIILRRALKVAAHETGHMFGLNHCIFFECMMNGSNHMDESDGRPVFLCPICLRKLYWNRGLDIPGRYRTLLSFCEEHGLSSEVEWLRRKGSLAKKAKAQDTQ